MSPSSEGRLSCRPGMAIESEGRSGCESSEAYRVAHREDIMVIGAETRGSIEEMLAEASRSCCAAIVMVKELGAVASSVGSARVLSRHNGVFAGTGCPSGRVGLRR